jgi:CcmD family protein
MEENLKWLWYAFSVAWVLVVLYVASLDRREKKLREELEALKAMVEDRGKR